MYKLERAKNLSLVNHCLFFLETTRLKANFSGRIKPVFSLMVLQIKAPHKRNIRKSLLTMYILCHSIMALPPVMVVIYE